LSSFDDYFATASGPGRAELERIRRLVRRTVPEAEKATSYGLPAFKYKQRPPFSPEAIEAARDALAGFDLSKGTVRFTADQPIPDGALEQVLGHRLREIESRPGG
jgi:uncharacterized protein YdhG (YjbR/CyaY superfamily)